MFGDKPRAAGGDASVVSAWARKGDRMRTLCLSVGALLVALMLSAVLAVGASATPVAKTVATVECEGASATLLMHPGGGGKAIWDISVESVENAPSYLIKRVEGTFYVGGVVVGTLDNSVGQKTGFGEPLTCAFEVHKPGIDAYGTLTLVQLR
jgi:hypothetical protein